jgi:hypothetical protein
MAFHARSTDDPGAHVNARAAPRGIGDNGPELEQPDELQQAEAKAWEEAAAPRSGKMLSREAFDAIVAENLRDFRRAQLDTALQALCDMGLPPAHCVILAESIRMMDPEKGFSRPGPRHLAAATGFSETTCAKVLSELRGKYPYLASTKLAIEAGQRAISVSTVLRPTDTVLKAYISTGSTGRDRQKEALAEVLGKVSPQGNGSDFTASMDSKDSDAPDPDFTPPRDSKDSEAPDPDFTAPDPDFTSLCNGKDSSEVPELTLPKSGLTLPSDTQETLTTYENPPGVRGVRGVREDSPTTTTVEYAAAHGDSGGGATECEPADGAEDLIRFIRKYGGNVDEQVARRMLANNIRTFGVEAVQDAYALTVAEMATGTVANPYKYLISTARGLRNNVPVRNGRGHASSQAETRRERSLRLAQEYEAQLIEERKRKQGDNQ